MLRKSSIGQCRKSTSTTKSDNSERRDILDFVFKKMEEYIKNPIDPEESLYSFREELSTELAMKYNPSIQNWIEKSVKLHASQMAYDTLRDLGFVADGLTRATSDTLPQLKERIGSITSDLSLLSGDISKRERAFFSGVGSVSRSAYMSRRGYRGISFVSCSNLMRLHVSKDLVAKAHKWASLIQRSRGLGLSNFDRYGAPVARRSLSGMFVFGSHRWVWSI
jgi:hypothetical protein